MSTNIVTTIGDSVFTMRRADRPTASSWNLWKWTHDSVDVMDNSGSNNGCALKVDGHWAGGPHGGDFLESVEMFVDGNSVDTEALERDDLDTVEADTLVTLITTRLFRRAVRVKTTLIMRDKSLVELLDIQGIKPSATLSTVYVSAWSRSEHFDTYAPFDVNMDAVTPVVTGVTTFPLAVVLKHSGATRTLTTFWSDGFANPFIIERPGIDTKLYGRAQELEGTADKHWAGATIHIVQ